MLTFQMLYYSHVCYNFFEFSLSMCSCVLLHPCPMLYTCFQGVWPLALHSTINYYVLYKSLVFAFWLDYQELTMPFSDLWSNEYHFKFVKSTSFEITRWSWWYWRESSWFHNFFGSHFFINIGVIVNLVQNLLSSYVSLYARY